ncbi:conserved unknown protein [Ectocarpus siliculosus]|uniref:Nuclear speckle splicing regulatory protein 1 N-terminal domain-containing protein n=1 Tax=Ectocarpus siliculosus TaxID=2880 RepID=D7G2R5_ECTSI|nr:conserved unknown protein [Ectocarpus siliculosus]|eukprot:CBJ26890.1 conserved unknown protein [Ectocarpus siliculosus]
MRKSGVKFGLIGTASSLKKGSSSAAGAAGRGRPIGSKPAPRRRPAGSTSVFDANSDDEEEDSKGDLSGVTAVNKRLAAISAKQEKQAKKEYEDALQADPSVFDYDRVYDGMKESRESKVAAATVAREKEKRQPKYIGNLLKQAKMRAVESDRIFDRKLQKEREAQDKLEGEATMKFVTSAYKKKLMEQKKWELQQQLEDEREQRNDVTKTGMGGFYSNLITKNIAMGGDVEKSANSAFTAGSKRHAATDEYEMQDGNEQAAATARRKEAAAAAAAASEGGPANGASQGGREGRDGGDADSSPGRTDESGGPTARMVDPRAGEQKKSRRDEAGVRDSERSGRRRGDSGEAVDNVAKRARLAGEASDGGDASVGDDGGVEQRQDERTDEEKSAAEAADKAREAAAAKAKKEAAVRAARERFLARKKAA